MVVKKIFKILFILLILFTLFIIYSKYFKKKETVQINQQELEKEVYSSNILKDVRYTTKDADGN